MIVRKPIYPAAPQELSAEFRKEGLTLVGVADALPQAEEEARYREWLDRGYAGSMSYLRDHAPLKFSPARILPGCRSLLFAAINYYQRPERAPSPGEGRIARYAWGRDYHRALGSRLRRIARSLGAQHPEETFRSFTDATPLAERCYAERAGIGFTGRNTLLLSGQFGSWFLVGEILSTRRYPASEPTPHMHGACPGGCRKCIDVCPTGALVAAGEIDASRCISYLTIEHKGAIPEELRPKIGNWLFGCDLCQEVCPLNVRAEVTDVADFLRINAGATQELAVILAIRDDEEFTRRFAGSPLMRAGRRGLIRNACVVAANNDARELLPRLRELAADEDDLIAEHASWAVRRLTGV